MEPNKDRMNSKPSGQTSLCRVNLPFPLKLHEMLDEEADDSIVSWLPHGKAFRVHKPKEFAQSIMPRFFRQSKYKSFQRQLHIYGFRRIRSEKMVDFGAYYHEKFLRGQKSICLTMTRQTIKGNSAATAEHLQDPDFYKEGTTTPVPSPNNAANGYIIQMIAGTTRNNQSRPAAPSLSSPPTGLELCTNSIFSSRRASRRRPTRRRSLLTMSAEPTVLPLQTSVDNNDPLPVLEYSSDEEEVDMANWFLEGNPEFLNNFGGGSSHVEEDKVQSCNKQVERENGSPRTIRDFYCAVDQESHSFDDVPFPIGDRVDNYQSQWSMAA